MMESWHDKPILVIDHTAAVELLCVKCIFAMFLGSKVLQSNHFEGGKCLRRNSSGILKISSRRGKCKQLRYKLVSFSVYLLLKVDFHLLIFQGASIIVATMGRLMHFVRERLISLQKVKYVVLDEADRMLDQGFSADINE